MKRLAETDQISSISKLPLMLVETLQKESSRFRTVVLDSH